MPQPALACRGGSKRLSVFGSLSEVSVLSTLSTRLAQAGLDRRARDGARPALDCLPGAAIARHHPISYS